MFSIVQIIKETTRINIFIQSNSYNDKFIELSLFYFQGFLSDLDNPYLTGEKLHVAAKKGLGY